MLDFLTKTGERITLEDDDNSLNVKLWDVNGEFMREINWDIDAIIDMLFTEQKKHLMENFIQISCAISLGDLKIMEGKEYGRDKNG